MGAIVSKRGQGVGAFNFKGRFRWCVTPKSGSAGQFSAQSYLTVHRSPSKHSFAARRSLPKSAVMDKQDPTTKVLDTLLIRQQQRNGEAMVDDENLDEETYVPVLPLF